MNTIEDVEIEVTESEEKRRKPGRQPYGDGKLTTAQSIRCRPETVMRIAEIAKHLGRTRSQVMGDVLDEFVEKWYTNIGEFVE